jgi:hypothetical protein
LNSGANIFTIEKNNPYSVVAGKTKCNNKIKNYNKAEHVQSPVSQCALYIVHSYMKWATLSYNK